MKIYKVGGCVRDSLLQKPVDDVDYVIVGASEREIQDMLDAGFKQVGADFPVFLHPDTGDEYALARRERKVGKGYLGFEVYTGQDVNLFDDLKRRDLTINSMALDADSGELIDPYGGCSDLHNRILRHTSEAFAEDPLRVIRLARFYARYEDFKIAFETVELCRRMTISGQLNELAHERLIAELVKTFKQTDRIDRFIYALQLFGALHFVKFYEDLFGLPPGLIDWQDASGFNLRSTKVFDRVNSAFLHLNKDELTSNERAAIFLAVVAAANGAGRWDSAVIPTDLKWLRKVLLDLNAFIESGTLYNYAELLLSIVSRGFSADNRKLLAAAFDLSNASGLNRHELVFSDVEIAEGAVQLVTSFEFPELSGKELGQAIKRKRIEMIIGAMHLKRAGV